MTAGRVPVSALHFRGSASPSEPNLARLDSLLKKGASIRRSLRFSSKKGKRQDASLAAQGEAKEEDEHEEEEEDDEEEEAWEEMDEAYTLPELPHVPLSGETGKQQTNPK